MISSPHPHPVLKGKRNTEWSNSVYLDPRMDLKAFGAFLAKI
jgi:hypothetical protein